MKHNQTSLNPAIKRYIKRKEKYLNRTCRKIWDFTNRHDETYLFGSFCRDWDQLIVIIGYFDQGIRRFIVPR